MPAITRVSPSFRPSGKSRIQNVPSLLRKMNALVNEVMPSAQARATNRVAGTVRTQGARDISDELGLKVSSVKRRIVQRKRATKADPVAILEIAGRPLNLVEFVSGSKKPRSPRGGITARAWGTKRKYPGVFLARMPNGEVIAVKRSAPGKKREKLIKSEKSRWAGKSPHIEAVFGPGIATETAEPLLTAARKRIVGERYPIELKREVSFRVAKLLKKRGLA